MAKGILKNLKCDMCNGVLVARGITYQHYENVVNYLPWPKDIQFGPKDLIRIYSKCAKKHQINSLLKSPKSQLEGGERK